MCFGIVGLELHGPTTTGLRFVVLALRAQGGAQVAVRFRKTALKPDRAAVMGDRLVKPALRLRDEPQIVIGQGRIGRNFQHAAITSGRFVQLRLMLQGVAQVPQCRHGVWLQLQGLSVETDRCIPPALLAQRQSQIRAAGC